MRASCTGAAIRVEGHETHELSDGWEFASAPPDSHVRPDELGQLCFRTASVPGTVAGALTRLGEWHPGDERDFDAEDWWFRTRFMAAPAREGERVSLCLEGLATVAEVHLNGEQLLHSDSMFLAHELDVGERLRDDNELAIRFRALAPLLRVSRRPRARWRTRVAADGNLRFFRTTLFGRAPGWAPRPAHVGPWRPVRLIRRRGVVVDDLALRAVVSGDRGWLECGVLLRDLSDFPIEQVEATVQGPSGTHIATLTLESDGSGTTFARGRIDVPSVERWWPHTHGTPALYRVSLSVGGASGSTEVDAGRVGFRSLAAGPSSDHELERDGLDVHINDLPIFCRGVVWTPIDAVGLAPDHEGLRAAVQSARDAGMNMLRLAGTCMYESQDFYDLCDELGMLVWQDFMFANLDYPFADEEFRQLVEREAREVLSGLRGRPSLTVLCGNSEVEQQVAMLGLDPEIARGEMYGRTLPKLAGDAGLDAIYVPSAPCGGELPFRPDEGVANYFGVGAYLRGLDDARRSGVRFASECLAFSNVPDEPGVERVLAEPSGAVVTHHPRWKAGVPRDVGPGWDFEDVRDHYLEQLFGVAAVAVRSVDNERYLELSRALTGELMAEVFGEWRRAASPCGGGLVLWWRDLIPGAGWGIVDDRGDPKVVYHHLRRALAPLAVWTTDEGLGGVAVHVANDLPVARRAKLRVALYRDLEARVAEGQEMIELEPHGMLQRTVEGLIGHFVDAAYAYRFGPPPHDAIVVSLESGDEPAQLLSQSIRFPAGRPFARESQARLGIGARASYDDAGAVRIVIESRRLAYGVRIHAPGFQADDGAFSIEPGGARAVTLTGAGAGSPFSGCTVTALNLDGALRVSALAQ